MKKLFYLLIVFGISNIAMAQYTLIPDAKFEAKLIELGIDKDGANGKVLTTSISSVTTLTVSWSGISNLTGIANFTSLKQLYCSFNNLTNLDVSKNKDLEKLICGANKLTSLDVSKNSALIELNCTKNTDLKIICIGKEINTQINFKKDEQAEWSNDCKVKGK